MGLADKDRRQYRLGLDIGSNSLGWFLVWLDADGQPEGLGPGGVRIFKDGRDPQSKTSNAVTRRVARGARRRRDRYLTRRAKLMSLLVEHGLMPNDDADRKSLECLDPYELRASALDNPLPAFHIGRTLFHLNQRRGFKSNRKTERGDNESGAIREASLRLDDLISASGARTLGEFQNRRHSQRQPVRVRNRGTDPGKADFEIYATRQMLLDEFEAIWRKQAEYCPAMTDAAKSAIHEAIFYQRPLKQPQAGKCSLDPARENGDADGFRCPWAHPLAQRFRIWQEVRNLAVAETGKQLRPLDKEEGNKAALALLQTGKVSFKKLRTLLNLPAESTFNLESEKRRDLLGDQTAAKLVHKNFFDKAWRSLPLEKQIEIVDRLMNEENESTLIEWLVGNTKLDAEAAARATSAILPDGHCRLGLRAIGGIVPHMEGGLNYPDAARAAGYDHAKLPTGELSPNGFLPYYGEWMKDDVVGTGERTDKHEKRWGRFPNPTVHIGLGQVRRVVNALITEYGAPAEIVIELTRDFKNSPQQVKEIEREQAKNQDRNDARAEDIRKNGQAVNRRNLLKMRLWEDLNPYDQFDRRCPYTGDIIGISRLLSEAVDIDHLIPFQDSWDDSAANKTVCLTQANRTKGKRTPYEAFGATLEWDDIAQRANGLPPNKRWRFAPDARERFEAQGGFLARQLNETGWLARLAKRYMEAVADPYKINVIPGRMTAMIRAKWGLNDLLPDHNYSTSKNRKDHRHHAIDALVAALTDRSLLQRMSSAYDEGRQKIEVPLPWETLRDDLQTALDGMTVSLRADHSARGKLHTDTAYGTVRNADMDRGNLVYRKGFPDLKETEIERIRDLRLRDLVTTHVNAEKSAGNDLKAALQSFAERTDIPGLPNGIRHVRLLKTEDPNYLVPISKREGVPYKSYSAGENAFVDIYETPNGRWHGAATTLFEANQPGFQPSWIDGGMQASFVMRVFKGDTIALKLDGKRTIMQVHRLEASANRFRLAPHNETGSLQIRHNDPDDPFRWLMASYNPLKEMKAERVRVDALGKVWRVRSEDALRSIGA